MIFSTSFYGYRMGPTRVSVNVSNFLTNYLNRKFTKKVMNDVYIGY
jgi:hypothetical protein